MFVLLFVVDLVAATARQEKPTFVDVRPDAALVDHVTGPFNAQNVANSLVLLYPVNMGNLRELYL